MEPDADGSSRRAVLGSLAGLLGGGAVAGAYAAESEKPRPVSLFAAGSLAHALEAGLRDRLDRPLQVEARGSTEVARQVASGRKDPDVVSVADVSLFEGILEPAWYAEFATNALVVAYNDETAGGRRVAEAGRERWYEPLLSGDVRLGRTDPDLDPLGYRTLLMLELASRYYETDVALRDRLPRADQVYPETQLVSQFETGSVDAAVTYRNMAVERGYDYVDLPSPIDFGDPRYSEEWYETVSYTLPSGRTVTGGLVSYASTVRHARDSVFDVFEAHVAGEYLREFGFGVPESYPRFTGDVPDRIRG